MHSRRFLLGTWATVVALGAAIAGANVRINLYGAFGDVRGEEHRVYSDERWTKFLHTFNYLPQNFDGMLIGSSIGGNLDTSKIPGYHVYNACLDGGNTAEAERLVSSALAHGTHLRLLLVSLDTLMLKTTALKAGGMEPRDYWSALGSIQLMESYGAALGMRAGLLPDPYTPHGSKDFEKAGLHRGGMEQLVAQIRALSPEARLVVHSPEAMSILGKILAEARAHGTRIIGFFPPLYDTFYQIRDLSAQEKAARALFAPGERIVAFNDGTHTSLTGNPESFLDGVHLTREAAAVVMQTLAEAVSEP